MKKQNTIVLILFIVIIGIYYNSIIIGQSIYSPSKGQAYRIMFRGKAVTNVCNRYCSSGTLIMQDVKDSEDQKWLFPETNDHFYFIYCMTSYDRTRGDSSYPYHGKALASNSRETTSGEIKDNDEFKWRIENAGSGKFYFFNSKTGTNLNVSGDRLVMGIKSETAKFELIPVPR